MSEVQDIELVIVRRLRAIGSEIGAGLDEIEALLTGKSGAPAPAGVPEVDVGTNGTAWTRVGELEGQSYKWPDKGGGLQTFDRFVVYESNGLKIGLGYVYAHGVQTPPGVGVFKLGTGGGSKYPIVYFQATDDYDKTKELIAPIRGRGGDKGKAMFRPGDQLPAPYDQLPVAPFREKRPGYRFNIVGVVAKEDDERTMIEHGAIQVRLRNL